MTISFSRPYIPIPCRFSSLIIILEFLGRFVYIVSRIFKIKAINFKFIVPGQTKITKINKKINPLVYKSADMF